MLIIFLLCSEKFRKTKKLPIVLEPYYLLEPAEQWYPPLFSIFLASLPEKIVNQYHWIINHTLDYFTLVLLFLITKKLTNLELAIIVGLIYSFFGPVLLEFKSLTSRSLTIPIFILFLCSDYLWISGYNIGLVSSILFCLILIFFTQINDAIDLVYNAIFVSKLFNFRLGIASYCGLLHWITIFQKYAY